MPSKTEEYLALAHEVPFVSGITGISSGLPLIR